MSPSGCLLFHRSPQQHNNGNAYYGLNHSHTTKEAPRHHAGVSLRQVSILNCYRIFLSRMSSRDVSCPIASLRQIHGQPPTSTLHIAHSLHKPASPSSFSPAPFPKSTKSRRPRSHVRFSRAAKKIDEALHGLVMCLQSMEHQVHELAL